MSAGGDQRSSGTAREYALFEWRPGGGWRFGTKRGDKARLERIRANYAEMNEQDDSYIPLCIVPVGEDVERERASLEAEIERLRRVARTAKRFLLAQASGRQDDAQEYQRLIAALEAAAARRGEGEADGG